MKNFYIGMMIVLTSSFLTAQKQTTRFGLKGGLNIATISGISDTSPITAFHLGALVEIKVSHKFAVQPELLYSAQGAKDSSSSSNASIKINYITIPVMAKFYIDNKFALEIGPQLGFVASSDATYGNLSFDFKQFINSPDFSFNLGSTYDFTDKFFIGVRYTVGLTKVLNEKVTNDSTKNNVFQISLGTKF